MNEPEWKDANPETQNLPNKGRTVIFCIAGGLAIVVLSFLGLRIRPVGLFVGGFAFFSGIGMLLRSRRKNYNLKAVAVLTIAGFLMMLANPRFGVVAGFAAYIVITGGIGLTVIGLLKAIGLAWELGQGSGK